MVQLKNRVSGLLMETGVSYNKQKLHKVGYFRELLSSNQEIHPHIRPLLKLSRDAIVRLQKTEYALVSSLQRDPLLADRIKRLRTVPGVGAQLKQWKLPFQRYNKPNELGSANRKEIVSSLGDRRLEMGNFTPMLLSSADALDAVLCAFAAKGVSDGKRAETIGTVDDEGPIAVDV